MVSTEEREFQEYVLELMQDLHDVSARRMFGGAGIFKDGMMFALIADGKLYLKTDEQNIGQFQDLDLEPFVYYKQDKPFTLSYSEVPEFALEEPDAMLTWAESAFNAALRANKKKISKSKVKKKTTKKK